MGISLRPGTPDDAQACGTICYEAFKNISEAHGFTPDFPSADVSIGLMRVLLGHRAFYAVVAEQDGRVVGSNFLDERNPIAGLGPITVDPAVQNQSIGRRLMENAHQRIAHKSCPGVRLVQTGFHTRSLALYSKLGYDVREPLACMQGPTVIRAVAGYPVRPATAADFDACNQLCRKIHGYDRGGELQDAITERTATVVEHEGRITGYATLIGFFGHAVGETDDELQALISAAEAFAGPGVLVPTRNAALFRWCLAHGLRVTQPLTLMSAGQYIEPAGAFLPSILY
ncbi:MAG: GNAT family N-acetyltransferase [Vicinamibacterales bacterium]